MGFFSKKKGVQIRPAIANQQVNSQVPQLPKLPELPQFDMGEVNNSQGAYPQEEFPQLPSFPNNSLGEQFSQNTIKEAITGEKEGEEVFNANEFEPENDDQMMQEQPLNNTPQKNVQTKIKNKEPVFIRIDKFEESLNTFEKMKKSILEIEKMLRDIKKIKDEEEKELNSWEKEIKKTRADMEKIETELFSRLG